MQFMGRGEENKPCRIRPVENGFVLERLKERDGDSAAGAFAVTADCDAHVNTDFYRGGWWDSFTMRWNTIASAFVSDEKAEDMCSPGGAVEIPFRLEAGESRCIRILFCWYVPDTDMRYGETPEKDGGYYSPWYAGRYSSVDEVMKDFTQRFDYLYRETERFSKALHATQLPDPVMDAVSSNLPILKSPTVLRQRDGRFWAWEGCLDVGGGSCYGSCTHVWNYAQAVCHLFPSLERTLRETEFNEDMDESGHQQFRSCLPIRKNAHDFHAASDGQPGGIMKMYREWRISGDTDWIASNWGRLVRSMEYCIRTWDPKEEGVFREPHHNTYDIEFWGADGMCTSFYLGALKAMSEIGSAIGEETQRYEELYRKGRLYMETVLWNGEYFIQIPEWKTLEASFDDGQDPVLKTEGPKYQYGSGCLSDGVCGAWLAKECGLGDILDPEKTRSHLLSVYKYNFRQDLSTHANPQRPGYAGG